MFHGTETFTLETSMITLMVLETDLPENELFLKLLSRGRQADTPFYFSVDNYDVNAGWIIFTRLDCAPAPSFRVAVAGRHVIVSQKDTSEVRPWLMGWRASPRPKHVLTVNSPEEAHRFVTEQRRRAFSYGDRKKMLKVLEQEVRDLLVKQGAEARAMCK